LLTASASLQRDVLRVTQGDAPAVAERLRRLPAVRDAHPDYIAHATFTPNDPRFPEQYGLTKIEAPTAWITTEATGVRVAVLDCGIHATHPDLSGQVVLEQNFSTALSTDDGCNHGTHVAGTVAAITNNGVGVASVAPKALIMNGRVLDNAGSGFFSDIDSGMQWATANGAKVISMSLGANIPCPASTQTAVNNAWAAGVVIVAAAGNSNLASSSAPGNCQNVIAVAATDSNDGRASFSNYGTKVEVAAPGVGILSTVNPDLNAGTEYASFSGTSMATPHVSGVAALIWSVPSLGTSNAAVRDRLFNTADKIPGTGTLWSQGRVNAANAVGPATPPPALHDAAVDTISASPTSVPQGSPVTVTVGVSNQGNVSDSFSVTLRDDSAGADIATQNVSTVPAGGLRTLSFTWSTSSTTAPVSHTLRATATLAGDSNSANNSKTTNVSVTQPAPGTHDVAITGLSAPSSATRGAQVTVTATVANQGNFTESFTVVLQDSTDNVVIGSQTVSNLAAGAASQVTFTWNTSTSRIRWHTLTATASTVVGETNTANNSRTTRVRILR
jgi:hypothetical protein